MRNYKRFALLLVLFSATLILASITGTISGIVTDPGGTVVPGAEITAVRQRSAHWTVGGEIPLVHQEIS